ncbi:MAG: peptidase, partial [Proteobacteria bacterium]|nr:peptidase [Pseudomonadota bacterium]
MRHLQGLLFLAGLFLPLAGGPSAAAETDEFEFWPGAVYDPAVPTVEEVLGYPAGDRITWPHDVITYFEALAKTAPDRIRVTEYARTWEGRPLIYVAISSAANIARLAEISDGMKRLADPRVTNRKAADALIASLPGSVWLAYAVHGNEISSTDAAMMTAYHLLAAKGDERIDTILENTVVFIDPLQNPDGRARFVHNFESAEGLEPNSNQLAAEHNEPWPFGRTNHYLFDMNRDWFALTQPETRGRVAALQEWLPLVFVDLHEMGSDSTYYFAPEAIPYNPHLADDQRASLMLFGRNNARWFDHFGFDYFTREIFDAFYPGYGASWPSYYGSIAMTYEQASSRGLVMRRTDGKEFHYRDTVRHHFVASLSTAEVVAANRRKFLADFYNYRVSAIAEGRSGNVRSYIIPAQRDQAAADKLAGLLAMQGVEVGRAGSTLRACGQNYEAGSYVIDLAQPAKRLIRTLLDPDVPMEEDFLAEQERRRAKNLPDEIYDVTAWSLPLMYNVDMDSCGRTVTADLAPAEAKFVQPGKLMGDEADVAYLVTWGTAAAGRLLAGALRKGIDVRTTDKAFTHEGRDYPAGTLIFAVHDNPDTLGAQLAVLAEASGAEVVGVNTGWVTEGPNFGSRNVTGIRAPHVAIAWDRPTSSYSAGNTRFVIERQFGYPVTAIRTRQIATADLGRFDVIILPEQISAFLGFGPGYKAMLGQSGTENLKKWVNSGGVLIALGNAMRYLADPAIDLISVRREDAFREKPANAKDEKALSQGPENGNASE